MATRSSRPGSGSASGRGPPAPWPWPWASGCSPFCWREGRRGFDERSLALALAAALALSPIVWLHYFVLLLVPIALARRTFGAIWLIPALFWITPYEENFAQHWRIAVGIAAGRPGACRGGAGDRPVPRTIPRDDALLESREPARRRPRHPVLPGRRLRRLRARRRGHLDRRERRDRRRRLRQPGTADVREPRDDARGGRLQCRRRRARHDLPDRPRRFRGLQRGLRRDVLRAVSRPRDRARPARSCPASRSRSPPSPRARAEAVSSGGRGRAARSGRAPGRRARCASG